ncbi:zinc finger protein 511 [Parasteatoda tepidariorum]|uniref:zinc finger protein 511 n=1 Tax=Parasteatoda tepidariorum TaxID=114398 RepID=UPI00077FAAB5|nr:zinc finger protein 511 [Parasteatoda tepidariorum]
MHCIKDISDFEALLKYPFEPKKIIYSIKSGYFHEGNKYCKVGEKQLSIDIDDESLLHRSFQEFPCGKDSCRAVFSSIHDYEIHYNSVHHIVCMECKRNFPSYNLLDAHIIEKHDSYHEAAACKSVALYDCFVEGCDHKFSSIEMRNEHIIGVHKYPPDFKFQSLKNSKRNFEAMDVSQSDELGTSTNTKAKASGSKKVPHFICFGQGSQRAFNKKNKKPYVRDISMKELGDAL